MEGAWKHRGPHPRVSTSVPLGWGPRLCIPSKFPGSADAAGAGPLSENHRANPAILYKAKWMRQDSRAFDYVFLMFRRLQIKVCCFVFLFFTAPLVFVVLCQPLSLLTSVVRQRFILVSMVILELLRWEERLRDPPDPPQHWAQRKQRSDRVRHLPNAAKQRWD